MFGEGKIWQPSTVKEFIQDETKCWNSGNKFSVFSIYHSGTQEFIGYLHIKHSLNDFAAIGIGHQNVAEIAYIIDQAFWGKGYGTEIAILGKSLSNTLSLKAPMKLWKKTLKKLLLLSILQMKVRKEFYKRHSNRWNQKNLPSLVTNHACYFLNH